jgi:hypothetical protein
MRLKNLKITNIIDNNLQIFSKMSGAPPMGNLT